MIGLDCMQKVKTGIQYIIAQCVGGVLGSYAAFNLLPSKFACHSLHHNDLACCICDTVGYAIFQVEYAPFQSATQCISNVL